MGSKPSVPRGEGAGKNPPQPVRQQPQRHRHHFDHDADGPDHHRSAAHGLPTSQDSPELKSLFKHLAFRVSASKRLDLVTSVQDVLVQELGIAQPAYEDLKDILQQECKEPSFVSEEEMERICQAFPAAAARLAENGSPFALLLKDVQCHLALARALEQVAQNKAAEGPDHLLAQKLGHWHGQLEVGDHPSCSLDMCRNLEKEDIAQAVSLAHDNVVQLIWNAIIRINKTRMHVRSHVDGEKSQGCGLPRGDLVAKSALDLNNEVYGQYNYSTCFNLVPASKCKEAGVPMGSAKLGLLRTLIGDVPCGTEDMLNAMEEEHKRSSTAKIAFRGSAGESTTACEEWDNALKGYSFRAHDDPAEDLQAALYNFVTVETPRSVTDSVRNRVLDLLVASPEAEAAALTRPEAMALLLLVGPMREVYSWRLVGAVHHRSDHTHPDDDNNPRPRLVSRARAFVKPPNERLLERQVASKHLIASEPRESRLKQPPEYEAPLFEQGFEVTLHCACSALRKLSSIRRDPAPVLK
jgi:hypothetical protein